ncbi:hypothetical protein EW146_g8291 [Bondarzewia mesenterica]|uniref:Linoleate 8R-lipoxygenase n=1 Tax=Bondarzewia mesenterica TaxID=1095465 RepID=A0A4S4LFU9_9AGAM|nr:hypothetical protein EW146_g8291 [Bondarzewia mesenterica]
MAATTSSSYMPSNFVQRASVSRAVYRPGLGRAYIETSMVDQSFSGSANALGEQDHSEGVSKIIEDLREQIKKGLPTYIEPSAIAAVVDAIGHLNSMDDRKMLLEHVLTFLSHMPKGALLTRLENQVIKLLYDDLAHPSATYLGNQYAYRLPDGSHNNINDPNMGKAGTPYARSVQQTHALPRNNLPDAGLVFDTLLKRDGFVKHPAGLSSMMFSFAALVIHTVFRTSHHDVNINETSSYVDLSPLYGHNEMALNKIRVRDGRGLLYPDTFAEDRLLLLPPAVCVLLVLFSRNHNYIARKLLEINERGTYVDPDTIAVDDPNRLQKLNTQEEDIFNTARLINCAWFGSAIFADYFGSILGLFNCLYRWHATTSVEDEKWVEQLMGHIFHDKPVEDLTVEDFKAAAKKIQAEEGDVTRWTIGKLKRQADNTFNDKDLANVLKDAMEHPASAFKARGTPHVMRLHEIMGIESNRRWGVCSLNEFRKFLGLKPYASFLEWNPNPEIADAAERLYGDIENLELYVGLQAEEAKPLVDGAGLCPGYTISRAILSDAIALTRGDRFFTADYTPFNMTAWGFADCQRNAEGPGNGSVLGRLLLRGLPGEFSQNSTYTWFPLQTPESMKGFLMKLGTADKYDFARPSDPGSVVMAKEYRDVELVLKSKEFKAPYASTVAGIVHGPGFFLASDDVARGERDQREVLRVLTASPQGEDKIAQEFYNNTRALMSSKSYSLTDRTKRNVDIARDVLKYVPLHWAASEIAGLQLKTSKHSLGIYTEAELYEMLTDIYTLFFLDVDPSKVMNLTEKVKEHVNELQHHIKAALVVNAGGRLSIASLVGSLQQLFSTTKQKKNARLPFAQSLFERGATADEVTNNILALLVGSTVELAQTLTNVVNFYLDDANPPQLTDPENPKNATVLESYVREALRIDPAFRGVYRESLVDQTVGNLSLKAGQRVFVDIANANLDPDVSPNPQTVDLTRGPKEIYLNGDGAARCLGDQLTTKIVGQVLKAVSEFNGLTRGPGPSGKLKRYKTTAENTLRYEYLGSDQLPTAWATSMVVQYTVSQGGAVQNGANAGATAA